MSAMAAYQEPTDVPAEQVPCRGQRVHWMGPIAVPAGEPRPGGVINLWWRCERCGAERYDQRNPFTLELEGRRYRYPDGYLRSKDDRPTAATWMATYLRMEGLITDRQAAAARRYRKELWETEGGDA